MLLKEVFTIFACKSILLGATSYHVREIPKFNMKIGPKQSPKIVDYLGFKNQHLVEQKNQL
jgi:hypothetical protein